MKLFRIGKLGIFCITAVLIILSQTDAYAQRIIFLNKGNAGAFDQTPSGITDFDIKLGEIFTLDIWFDVGGTDITGISNYMTFDNTIFEVIDQGQIPEIQPFLLTGGFSAFTQHNANLVEDPNTIPGFQITAHSQLGTGATLSGTGRFARVSFRAVSVSQKSDITIDSDRGNFRDTRMFFTDLTSRDFDVFGKVTIRVLGVNVEGIPDILMEPGQTLTNEFDLDEFLLNEPENPSILGWNVSPQPQDSVLVTINAANEVTIISLPGFTGFRDFIFTVNDPQGVNDSDTMRVSVTYKPVFNQNFPNPIIILEDESFTGLFLDTLARDLDDDSTTLSWESKSRNENITVTIDNGASRTFTVRGKKDFNGNGEIVFKITDPKGASDSLIVSVVITPVNDPPRISGLPDIHLLPGQSDSSITLQDFVIDVDSPLESVKYAWSGELNVIIRMNENTRLTFSSNLGFEGMEMVIFRAFDVNPASATFDTIFVTVGPKPPEFIIELPDTTIFSSNLVSVVRYVDLDNFVKDDDDPLSSLIWKATGEQLSINIDSDHVAQFVVPPKMHAFEKVLFTVSDPAGGSIQDVINVLVLDNGRPLITDLPDELFVSVGGDTIITLGDFVVDRDTPAENLTWLTSGNQNITISINNTPPHLTTIASPNLSFTGSESVVFTVKDNDNNIDTHTMKIRVITPGKPILSDIPDIEITKNRTATFDLDDYLTIIPETERLGVVWSVSPPNDSKVNVSINISTNEATFTLLDKEFKGVRDFIFTARNTANGETASDPMSVTVTFGKDPILGHFPDLEFVSGDSSEHISLNKFVIDEDTPDDSIAWEVSSINVFPKVSNLKVGANHILVLTAREGFVGVENITVTAIDPEGNTASSEIKVSVRSSATLELMVLPNPISTDYIDIVVFASDTIIGSPSVELVLNDQTKNLDVQKIGNEFIWKADHVFESDQTGDVKIISIAADNFGSTIQDSTEFTLGSLSKSSIFQYEFQNISIDFPINFVNSDSKIMLFPDERMNFLRSLVQESENPVVWKNSIQSFYLGGVLDEDYIIGNGRIFFDLSDFHLSGEELRQAGIYYVHPETRELKFISNSYNPNYQSLYGNVNRFGLYFISVDDNSPEINLIENPDPFSTNFKVRIVEEESGIRDIQTVIDAKEYKNVILSSYDDLYEIAIQDFVESGDFTLRLTVIDNAGNSSRQMLIPFKRENVSLPKSYRLLQNYPNPFNPNTTIQYELPQNDFVSIIIFNTTGQIVKSLVNEHQSAGVHTVKWDARNEYGMQVATGMYIYRLKTNNFHDMKKMIVIK